MASKYVESFLELTFVAFLCVAFLLLLYYLLGKIKMPSEPSYLKEQGYSGGKEYDEERGTFKTLFFQYAIYFLIFDTIAFVTAVASFLVEGWKFDFTLFWPDGNFDFVNGINQIGVHVLIYISIVAFLLIILPKYKEDEV